MTEDNTPLGARMRAYERPTRIVLPSRTYTLMRLDGRAFHTYLRNAEKPFDMTFMEHMDLVALRLCEEIQGAQFAYTQSDEISLLITDFEATTTQSWFGGNASKMVSVAAGMASAYMAQLRYYSPGLPHFDCRVWTMTDPVEVANYFVWRQQDMYRNSIQMAGQAYFSHRELEGKSLAQVQDMLWKQHNVNWNDYPPQCKRGRLASRSEGEGWVSFPAPPLLAQPGSVLAQMIPPLPSLPAEV